MGLVVNFPSNLEDRMCIAIRDKNNRNYFPTLDLKYEDVGEDKNDDNTKGCNYHFRIHHTQYNQFFEWLSDIQNIMGIPFKFRYTTNQREAYTGYSDNNMFKHQWLIFKS